MLPSYTVPVPPAEGKTITVSPESPDLLSELVERFEDRAGSARLLAHVAIWRYSREVPVFEFYPEIWSSSENVRGTHLPASFSRMFSRYEYDAFNWQSSITTSYVKSTSAKASVIDRAVRSFSALLAVDSVFQEQTEAGVMFWVFTNNQVYDDSLMNNLLDIEEELLDAFPDLLLSFRYVPLVLCPDRRDVVGTSVSLVYER